MQLENIARVIDVKVLIFHLVCDVKRPKHFSPCSKIVYLRLKSLYLELGLCVDVGLVKIIFEFLKIFERIQKFFLELFDLGDLLALFLNPSED